MMRFIRPRLRAPAQMALIGLAATVAVAVGQGWGNAIPFGALIVALAVVSYVWGGRDTDRGALIGSRADERQASLQMKVTAFQGKVLSATAASLSWSRSRSMLSPSGRSSSLSPSLVSPAWLAGGSTTMTAPVRRVARILRTSPQCRRRIPGCR